MRYILGTDISIIFLQFIKTLRNFKKTKFLSKLETESEQNFFL